MFALTREKNSCKYYMFKNKNRRDKFKSHTLLLNVLIFISVILMALSMLLFIGTFIVWLIISFITTKSFDPQSLGLIFTIIISIFTPWFIANFLSNFTVDFLTNISIDIPHFTLLDVAPILMYVFIALVFILTVLKFTTEWKYILEEARELKSNPKENQNQIALSEVIIKVKKFGLVSTIIAFSLIAALTAVAFIIQTITAFVIASIFCVVIFILYIIMVQIFSSKQFKTVHEKIYEIREKEHLSIVY